MKLVFNTTSVQLHSFFFLPYLTTLTLRTFLFCPPHFHIKMDHMNDTENHDTNHGSDNHEGHDHGSTTTNKTTMHGMSPFLFTRSSDFYVLFSEAFIDSTGNFVLALFATAFFALLATILSQSIQMNEPKALHSGRMLVRLYSAVLFGFRSLLHYIAMLIVMTMNVWLIIAVIVGHTLGWFIFSVVLGSYLSRSETKDMAQAC